jgi:hypothetical protein
MMRPRFAAAPALVAVGMMVVVALVGVAPGPRPASLDERAVRVAASQCKADPTCVPSVDKLVRLASRYCACTPPLPPRPHRTARTARTAVEAVPLTDAPAPARGAGAKEPSCVCNWGATPRACFLAEVQKHPKLMIEAKILEDSIKQKQEIRQEEARIARIVRRDDGKFSTLVDRGHEVRAAAARALRTAGVRSADVPLARATCVCCALRAPSF